MVQMIWTFDIFMTKLQNCKNNLVQNSDTRGTMISKGLNMTIISENTNRSLKGALELEGCLIEWAGPSFILMCVYSLNRVTFI